MPRSHHPLYRQARLFAGARRAGAGPAEAARTSGFPVVSRVEELLDRPFLEEPPDARGTEHLVYLLEDRRRVLKIPVREGSPLESHRERGLPDGLEERIGFPGDVQYLARLLGANLIFGDDIRIEAWVEADGCFLWTQPFRRGRGGPAADADGPETDEHPTPREIIDWFEGAGWRMFELHGSRQQRTWISPDGRFVVEDAKDANFIVEPDGAMRFIDAIIRSQEEFEFLLDPEDFLEAYGRPPRSLLDELDEAMTPDRFGFRGY